MANMKQELSLNHSMIMDQLNRIVRELNKLKPSVEELGQSTSRQAERLKEELTDEMVRVTAGLTELEKELREGLEQRFQELRKEVLENLEREAQTQQETLDRLTVKVETFSRQTTASLSQLRMALSMAEIEADLRQRNPDAKLKIHQAKKGQKAAATAGSKTKDRTKGATGAKGPQGQKGQDPSRAVKGSRGGKEATATDHPPDTSESRSTGSEGHTDQESKAGD